MRDSLQTLVEANPVPDTGWDEPAGPELEKLRSEARSLTRNRQVVPAAPAAAAFRRPRWTLIAVAATVLAATLAVSVALERDASRVPRAAIQGSVAGGPATTTTTLPGELSAPPAAVDNPPAGTESSPAGSGDQDVGDATLPPAGSGDRGGIPGPPSNEANSGAPAGGTPDAGSGTGEGEQPEQFGGTPPEVFTNRAPLASCGTVDGDAGDAAVWECHFAHLADAAPAVETIHVGEINGQPAWFVYRTMGNRDVDTVKNYWSGSGWVWLYQHCKNAYRDGTELRYVRSGPEALYCDRDQPL